MTLVGAASVASKGTPSPPDLKVAVFTGGACGAFGDSLPALVTRVDLRPGEIAGDVTVCLRMNGDAGRQLTLRVAELVELDVTCTGEEGTLDRTCGGLKRGELAGSLVQQAGVASCAAPPPTNPSLERTLTRLRDDALQLTDRLGRGELACARLVLVYRAIDPTAAVVSQSDRVTWRYVFGVRGE